MKKIGLLSDTHGYLHPKIFEFFKEVDEIWHAGDFGNIETLEKLEKFKPLRGVYGNVDDTLVRHAVPLYNHFSIEHINVLMTHIGGYPDHYLRDALEMIQKEKPKIFISGHSHILKVMCDKENQLLHINPGAAGLSGIHQVITLVRFTIDGSDIRDMEICETEKRWINS